MLKTGFAYTLYLKKVTLKYKSSKPQFNLSELIILIVTLIVN